MSSLLFGNGTDIVHWKSSPNTRGTFEILSTCVITMLLCVWTAVHLNVSPPGSFWAPKLRKIGWLILALLAPEMVAYTAWYQRQRALSIMHEVNNAYKLSSPPSWHEKTYKKAVDWFKRTFTERERKPTRQPTLESQKSSSPENRHPWTIVHGFYALMGGIAFEIPETESKKFLPPDPNKTKEFWFVDYSGILLLLKQENGREVLPDLTEEEIKSKSKANGLAKALVCTQALWFIAQCITRLAQRIPISLLELNTFGHAVCALLMYLLWWEKPFEVDYPTTLKDQILWDMRAFHWSNNNLSSAAAAYFEELVAYEKGPKSFPAPSKSQRQKILLEKITSDFDLFTTDINDRPDNGNQEDDPDQQIGHINDNEASFITLTPGQNLQGTDLRMRTHIPGYLYDLDPRLLKITLTSQDISRLKMGRRFGKSAGLQMRDWETSLIDLKLIARRCKDWPETSNILEELSITLGFITVALIYGGIHALAWSANFDSLTEQLLWRISACLVMGGLPVGFFLLYLNDASFHNDSDYFLLIISFRGLLTFLFLLLCPAYVLARAYLVVECFINLSHLPVGVYDVPQWATYFPHIS